MFQRPDLTAI